MNKHISRIMSPPDVLRFQQSASSEEEKHEFVACTLNAMDSQKLFGVALVMSHEQFQPQVSTGSVTSQKVAIFW